MILMKTIEADHPLVLEAFDWIERHVAEEGLEGRVVINCSWGSYAYSRAIYRRIASLHDIGFIIVTAAGNDGVDACGSFPGNMTRDEKVITVGATERYGRGIWSSISPGFFGASNYGPCVSIWAQGSQVQAAVNTLPSKSDWMFGIWDKSGYKSLTGTSFGTLLLRGHKRRIAFRSAGSYTMY
jgi:subtilisin family serine protease